MDRRYTDYDVRANPNLRALAFDYLRQYNGQFQFLNECKAVLESGRLSDQQVRGVLNSMLADPKVTNMPTPVHTAFDAGQFAPPRRSLELNVSARPEPVRQTIKLPTRWHYEFGISNHKQARVIHNVDPRRSHGILDVDKWEIRWIFFWKCAGYSMPKPYEKRLALFNFDDAVLMISTHEAAHIKHLTEGGTKRAWKWCVQCDRMSGRN